MKQSKTREEFALGGCVSPGSPTGGGAKAWASRVRRRRLRCSVEPARATRGETERDAERNPTGGMERAVNRGPYPGPVLDEANLESLGLRPEDRADLLEQTARLDDHDRARVADAAARLEA